MSIRRQLALSYAQKYTSVLLQLISMIVLARLMTPAEVGQFAAGMAFIALGSVLAEFGQADYLLQAQHLSEREERTAFGVALTSAWLCALLIVGAAALLIPDDQQPLRYVIQILALAVALKPLSLLLRAQLLRQFRLKRLYVVNVTKDIALNIGGMVFVYAGNGAAGLAIAMLLEEAVLTMWAVRHHMQSGWRAPSLRGAGALLHFGGLRSAVYALGALGESISRLTLSGMLGYAALGLVNRAQKITTIFDKMVLDGFMPVLLPYISSQVRKGSDLGAVVIEKAALLSGLAWPFFLFVALAAEPLIVLLLGDRWTDAVSILRILCLGGIALPVSAGMFLLLTATGLLRLFLPWQALTQAIVIGAAVLGSLHSLQSACLAFVLAQWLKACFGLWTLRRAVAIPFLPLLQALIPSMLLAALTGVAVGAALQLPLPPSMSAIAAGSALALSWVAGIFALRHPLSTELARLARSILRGSPAAVAGK